MRSVERSALVNHSAERMFHLINDVDSYQEFLPWCGSSRVIRQDGNEAVASITINFKGIRQTFTTQNHCEGHHLTRLKLVDGPFKTLDGQWRFEALSEDTSRISLELQFAFNNRLIDRVLGPVFSIIADSMVDSFCRRADDLYKGRTPQ